MPIDVWGYYTPSNMSDTFKLLTDRDEFNHGRNSPFFFLLKIIINLTALTGIILTCYFVSVELYNVLIFLKFILNERMSLLEPLNTFETVND